MGSRRKHTAKDGAITWRVRIDITDPVTGERRQPQRTYRTRREAELGLARWMTELHLGEVASPVRLPREGDSVASTAVPRGTASCLRAIATTAEQIEHLGWVRHPQAAAALAYIIRCARAGLRAFEPELVPLPSVQSDDQSTSRTRTVSLDPLSTYHVYRLLAGGVPFYVGQSRNVAARVQSHISAATGGLPAKNACAERIRQALEAGDALSYEIVASAASLVAIRQLEREWIIALDLMTPPSPLFGRVDGRVSGPLRR